MSEIHLLGKESLSRGFIPTQYLPEGKDEYYLRDIQASIQERNYRPLRSDEVEVLVKNNNTADNWDDLLVSDPFEPNLIKNNRFFGLVRLGTVREIVLEYHDLFLPAGITNSLIISCDVGDDCAIHEVHYLAHYILGNNCILFNLDEMHTTNYAKFGNGIVKEGEKEEIRIWLDIMNETGCRKVIPFDGMITADAYLWGKYRDDHKLQTKLKEITQKRFDKRRGYYGTVGNRSVIKNSRILKDVRIGSHCYIKGANKLKNLTINSSQEEPSQIGEGVELVNGIIGYGCHIFYGCKAVRFILGNNSNLKYGARLINSYLGDNSTISCCEVLNNLIFPAHEQHHNNSFLIASVVMGQSNMAAGATIGSNHNSRANDNEIQAGRGFWPGLCTSLKHSCRFVSFVLLSKADYPSELDIPFPFSLLNNNYSADHLEITPAFWWRNNMYALARNSWKFIHRDKRQRKVQNIEFDHLAPDTAEEILFAMTLLERWTGKAALLLRGEAVERIEDSLLKEEGKRLLEDPEGPAETLEVLGEGLEKSHRKVVIIHPQKGYQAYKDMLLYYGVKNLALFLDNNPKVSLKALSGILDPRIHRDWVNLGGQLIPKMEVDKLREDIGTGSLSTWEEIHHRYQELWAEYPLAKQAHALFILRFIYRTEEIDQKIWLEALGKARRIQDYICEQVYQTRKKDFENPFRKATFRNQEEMEAALGRVEDNDFVLKVREETEQFTNLLTELEKRN